MSYKKTIYRGYDVITPECWWSEPVGTIYGAVWDYLPPVNECRFTFKRRDGQKLFYPDTGSLVALPLEEAADLYAVLGAALNVMRAYNLALDSDPYALLRA